MWRLLPAVFSILLPAVGHAENVRLVVNGVCPTRQALEGALKKTGLVIDEGANAELQIRSTEGKATLLLSRGGGQEVAQRDVVSEDCTAIAEAFALIVVEALVGDSSEQDTATDEASETEPAPHAAEPPGRSEKLAVEVKPLPGQKRASRLSVALIGGVGTSDSADAPGLLQADVAWKLAGYRVRTALWGHSTSSLARLERRQLGIRFEFGEPMHFARLWIRPSAGIAAVASHVTFSTSGQHDLVRVHPALSATVSIGWELTQKISLRADVLGLWYPIADRYLSGMEVVGESPRRFVGGGLGLEYRIH